jgi:hypothetical protein
MDTYASSAGDPGGFYDVSALAGAVDAFFVMEYSPNVAATTQAGSPLTSSLFSDLTTVEQYAAAVPADKVILGIPLFGEDWPTTANTLSATAVGPAAALTDSEIEGVGHPIYWDPVTDSAWTAYEVGNQWREAFFDDPNSLYQIAHIASQSRLGGVGVWALGMEGADPAMVDALEGIVPAIPYATPPTVSTATSTPSSTFPTAASVPSIAPPASTSGGASSVPAASAAGGDSSAAAPPALGPSFTGTFAAETLASIENDTPTSSPPPSPLPSVPLCLVTMPTQSTGCGAPDPLSADATALTAVAPGLTPPFPGATVVGVLSGITVKNDAALSCLETDNQLAELGPSTANATTPELVVWQWPNNQQYYYVMTTTTPTDTDLADCANATLAFPVPSKRSATPR